MHELVQLLYDWEGWLLFLTILLILRWSPKH